MQPAAGAADTVEVHMKLNRTLRTIGYQYSSSIWRRRETYLLVITGANEGDPTVLAVHVVAT